MGSSLQIVGVYVDDLVITGAATREIDSFKQQMTKPFRMSDLGKLGYYLGIEVSQEHDRIVLGQAAYAKRLLERAGMEDCSTCNTPMEVRLKLSKRAPPTGWTRLCIAASSEGAPASDHYAAVKHLLRYVAGTLDHGCAYGRGEGALELTGYSDSDHAGDSDDRKNTTGVIFLGRSPVSW
nr:uncharacterized mitochondrial protein AtMg00810-like [Aegilops tauschii subsp. strangulata]